MEPIQKNKKYTVEIIGMNHEGQGVGRVDDFIVFVEGAILDEVVEILAIKVTKSYAVGKLLKIIKPTPARTTPFCASYKRCGGCSLQHMSYKAQLDYKTNIVKDAVQRIGKIEGVHIHSTMGMKNAFRYRNKAQFPVGQNGDKVNIGFYAGRTHEIIESSECGIQDELSDRVRNIVKDFMIKYKISVYDEKKGSGLVRHIITRVGFKTGEIMVVIVISGKDLPFKKELIDELTKAIPGIKSIMLNVNTKNTNVILGGENIRIFGNETITDFIGKFKFEISPLSFYQVNSVQTEVLYKKALEYAGLAGNEVVFDLYCGIGTISIFLSEKAKKVYGVEVVEEAVRDAKRNAELNNVRNVEFITGEVERIIPEVYQQGVKADVVVLDPPRKGCDEVLLKAIVEMEPQRIVYVSCNPSTLARDLKFLTGNGFKAVEIQPVDMFPYTPHVETIVLIQREYM